MFENQLHAAGAQLALVMLKKQHAATVAEVVGINWFRDIRLLIGRSTHVAIPTERDRSATP